MKPIDTSKTDIEFDALITRMMDLAKTGTVYDHNAEAAKQIGQDLHALGGLDAMQSAYYVFRGVWPRPLEDDPTFHPADWFAAWDGIGNWTF